MKLTVNPCDDFYEYACGNWPKNHPIPNNTYFWNPRAKLDLLTRKRVQKILEDTGPADINVEKARMWYKSYARKSRGLEPVISMLSEIGGWPLALKTEEWDENKYNWQEIDKYYSRNIGQNAFFSIDVIPNFETYDHMLSINSQKLPLHSETELDHQKIYSNNKYKNFIIEMALAISKESRTNAFRQKIENEVNEYLKFEKQLAESQMYFMTWGVGETKKQTIEELENFLNVSRKNMNSRNSASNINILDMINDILRSAGSKTINKTEVVNVKLMNYLSRLTGILDRTPPRTIVNFIHWLFISNVIDFTSETYMRMKFDVKKTFQGPSKLVPQSQICEETVKMRHAVGNEFVKKYFQPSLRNEAKELTQSIQNSLEKLVSESKWMDETARIESVEKVRRITKLIGNADLYDDKFVLLDKYSELSIGSKYFENEMNYMNFNFKQKLRNLGKEFDFDWWLATDEYHSPLTINAFYVVPINSISIPAANFQPPFFTSSQPDYLNYGFIGFLIAHEMSHTFDNQGIRINHEGEWSNLLSSTNEKYDNKTSCFIRQTTELTKNNKKSKFQEQHGIGLVTNSENIADTMGLQVLYKAYKNRTHNKNQLKLPDLEHFSNDQLFFLAFANYWCENISPEMDALRAENDNHNKPKYRIIGSLSNSKEFAEAFRCPIGSPMNSKEKCLIF